MARDDDDDDDDSGDPWDLVDAGWRGLKDFFGDHRTEEEKERSLDSAFESRMAEEQRWNDISGDSDYMPSGGSYTPPTPLEQFRIDTENAFVDSPLGQIWLAISTSCFGELIGALIKISLVLIALGLMVYLCATCSG